MAYSVDEDGSFSTGECGGIVPLSRVPAPSSPDYFGAPISSQLAAGIAHPVTRSWQAERQLTKVNGTTWCPRKDHQKYKVETCQEELCPRLFCFASD